jgi:tRNA (guanine-N7-)-methyltransferase
LDDAPGIIGVSAQELPVLPDEAMTSPEAGRVDPRLWFPDPSRPLEIEIGCGKGTFILEQAKREPGVNYLGIEWAREFYLYAADRVRRAGLKNVRMLRTDATEFLRWRCPNEIARTIHLYFSDPWPKSKHHKNRVVQDRFLGEVWRVLGPVSDAGSWTSGPGTAPSGSDIRHPTSHIAPELRVVTDHDDLWAWDMEHFQRWTTQTEPAPGWKCPTGSPAFEFVEFTPPEWVGEGELVGTNYERKKCLEVGKGAHAGVLRKRGRL